ncbi:MAG: hypothetical protein MZV70_03565 [Desulfobacterales bacterium]|nr:hypothetical protein [Desulfobacterales bacterium]
MTRATPERRAASVHSRPITARRSTSSGSGASSQTVVDARLRVRNRQETTSRFTHLSIFTGVRIRTTGGFGTAVTTRFPDCAFTGIPLPGQRRATSTECGQRSYIPDRQDVTTLTHRLDLRGVSGPQRDIRLRVRDVIFTMRGLRQARRTTRSTYIGRGLRVLSRRASRH